MNKLLKNGKMVMKQKTKDKIVNYLMDKHGDKQIASMIEGYFRLSLTHAEKDGILKIVEKDGEEYVKLLVSSKELDSWFQKQQDANLLGLSVAPDNKDLFEETPSMISLNSFSDMLSGLQYDSAFESCVNDKLNTPGDDEECPVKK